MSSPDLSEDPIELVVGESDAGVRLDALLAARFPVHSRTHLRRAIVTDAVTVDGRRAKPAYRLRPGQRIRVVLPDLPRSRAVPEPYQLVPLLMALEASPVRLLIGDDVGIGKTIEAGLIVSELVARGAVQRILVVLPPALREQWQEALSRFFRLDAVIMAGHTRPALERQLLPGQSPWEAFPRSLPGVRTS